MTANQHEHDRCARNSATLSGSCQTNQLRSSSLLFGTLSHGAHEPISIAMRTRFLDAPAYGSKCSFAKIAIPYTIYISLNSYPLYIYQHRSTDLLLVCTFLQYATHKCYLCDAPSSLPFHKKFKHPHTIDEYSHKSNERKILTVLRRNSIIIVNCSAEYI